MDKAKLESIVNQAIEKALAGSAAAISGSVERALAKSPTKVPTAGNNPRGTGPEAMDLPVDVPAVSLDPLAASIVSYLVAEAWAATAGSKEDTRFALLDKRRDEIIARAAVLRAFAAQVAHDSSPGALREKAQAGLASAKLAKLQQESAELQEREESAIAKLAKAEGKPAPAGTTVYDAIRKQFQSPRRFTPGDGSI